MAEKLFSASWYRVRDLRPSLRAHAQIHRHQYRGEVWYVVQDHSSERFHRFTPSANFVIGIMNGARSVEDIWVEASEELGDDAPTQDEMIQLLGQLHAADLLRSGVPPDVMELFERWEKQEKQQLKGKLMSPFAIRIPLWDPEKFLAATVSTVRPIFGPIGGLTWLALVIPALVLVGIHWTELTEGILDRLLAPSNLLIMWLIFPILKAAHELGHGYMAKVFGGQVHDMGIMFLVFTPVPYVDASSSWAFGSKYRRALVGAGGMIVEIFLAALAFYVWLLAEPGAVRSTAYNVLIIGGVTTLLFNLNPLLRFDGYYILSDLLEIPNLRVRANKYIGYLAQRYAFGNTETEAPRTAPGEPGWFVGFAVTAFIYRIFIVIAILSWILSQFFFVGLVLGLFAMVGWFGVPLYKGLVFLFSSPSLRRVRRRAVGISGGALAAVLLLILLLPVPLRTRAEGVVWIPDEALVRPRTAGFVSSVEVEPNASVEVGDVLISVHDPSLAARHRALRARVGELEALYASHRSEDISEAEVTREELGYAKRELAETEQRVADFEIRAGTAGKFAIAKSEDLPGRFVRQGDLLAHVVDLDRMIVRAVVSQDDADLVRARTEDVQVRMAERVGEVYDATVKRLVPAASERLPSRALGLAGGGSVAVDPRDPEGSLSVQSMFEVELEVAADTPVVNPGGRVYIRFDLGNEALMSQWYRRIRQIFLARFHV